MGHFFIQTTSHFAGDSSFSLLVQLWFPSKHNALRNNLLQQIPFINNKPKLCLKEHQDRSQKRWDLFTKRTRRCKWMRQEQWEKEAWCLKVNVQWIKTVGHISGEKSKAFEIWETTSNKSYESLDHEIVKNFIVILE